MAMANDKPEQKEMESSPTESSSQPQQQPQIQQQTQPPIQQHIRPRVQRKPKRTSTKKEQQSPQSERHKRNETDTTANVEATRKKMESWMGLGGDEKEENKNIQKKSMSKPATTKHRTKPRETEGLPGAYTVVESNPSIRFKEPQTQQEQEQEQEQQQQVRPVSILKSPKYSSRATNTKPEAPAVVVAATAGLERTTAIERPAAKEKEKPSSSSSSSMVICKDIVVERDPTIATTKRKSFRKTSSHDHNNNTVSTTETTKSAVHYASAIEGYIPTTTTGISAPFSMTSSDTDTTTNSSNSNISNNNNNSGSSAANDEPTGTRAGDDDDDEKGEPPLVIDSLEGLMRAAGASMPADPHKIDKDTKMVEANISFSVMTKDQYETKLPAMKEAQEEERQEHLRFFLGKHDIFGDDDDESVEGALEREGNGLEDNDDDDDDDAIMELLLGSTMEDTDEEENTEERPLQVKAFTLLWDALTNWMTHETVQWMKTLRDTHHRQSEGNNNNNNNSTKPVMDTEWTPMVDQTDIGASRCAGVLAMLRLYLPQCMEELGHPFESRRRAEKRLNDFLRTFDYSSRENPKLSAAHWKAMACVLLDAVLIETRNDDIAADVPPSVAKLGMTKEEFEYLSRKAVLIFE